MTGMLGKKKKMVLHVNDNIRLTTFDHLSVILKCYMLPMYIVIYVGILCISDCVSFMEIDELVQKCHLIFKTFSKG